MFQLKISWSSWAEIDGNVPDRPYRGENNVSVDFQTLFPHREGLSGTFFSISDHGSPISGPEKCLNEFSITCWTCFANYILAPSRDTNQAFFSYCYCYCSLQISEIVIVIAYCYC